MDSNHLDQTPDPSVHTDKLSEYSAFLTEYCGKFMAHIIVDMLIFSLLLLTGLIVLFIPTLMAYLSP